VSVHAERDRLAKENQQLQADAVRADVERLRKANEQLRKSLESGPTAQAGSVPLTQEQVELQAENEKLRATLIQAQCDRLRKENEALRKTVATGPLEDEAAEDCQFVPASFSPEDFARLQKENKLLREQQRAGASPLGPADSAIREALDDKKYGRNPPVTTKRGRLTIGGLLQVWYYTIQRDMKSYVNASGRTALYHGSQRLHFRARHG
jgi:hypothetical protein